MRSARFTYDVQFERSSQHRRQRGKSQLTLPPGQLSTAITRLKGRPYRNNSYQLKTPLSGSSTRGWEDSGNNDGTTFGSRLKLHSTTAVVVVLHYGVSLRCKGEATARPANAQRRSTVGLSHKSASYIEQADKEK
jgi:hypothetical protein